VTGKPTDEGAICPHDCSSPAALFSKALEFEYPFDSTMADMPAEEALSISELYVNPTAPVRHNQRLSTTHHVIVLDATNTITKHNWAEDGHMC
jgi:hypothetical protein